jgi:high-affinity nickel-transport protein
LHSEPPTALLLINAFLLGLRHGIDWDHIAAIFDIVGFGSYPQTGLPKPNKSSLLASFCYATGHGLVVVALGTAAICFS